MTDDDNWLEEFEREERQRAEQFERFKKHVKRAMDKDGAFEIRSQFEHWGGSIILHKSTRPGVAYQVTFVDRLGPSGHSDAPSLDAAIKRAWEDVHPKEKKKFAQANRNRASAPAEPSERRRGSSKNRPGSSSTTRGGIRLAPATEKALRNKVKEHNSDPNRGFKVNLGMLKSVWRRGAGAFSTSHRPGQTRSSWAMARVNAFLKLVRSGEPKNPKYVTDNDLLPKDHPRFTGASRNPRGPSRFSNEVWVSPPFAARALARKALAVRQGLPMSRQAGTATGLGRARSIAAGEEQPAREVAGWFARHLESIIMAEATGKDMRNSKALQAAGLWGGASMAEAARKAIRDQ